MRVSNIFNRTIPELTQNEIKWLRLLMSDSNKILPVMIEKSLLRKKCVKINNGRSTITKHGSRAYNAAMDTPRKDLSW